MVRKKKSKRSTRKLQANATLKSLFRLSREQLVTRKTTGGGLHKTRKDIARSAQKRQALRDQIS